jgi:hypothetical protein
MSYLPLIVFAVFVLISLGQVYVVVPIKLKSQPLKDLSVNYLPFDPNTLGPEVAGFFYQQVQALTAQGLTVVQYLTKPNAQKNLTSVVIYLVDRQRGERCTVSCFYVTVNGVTSVRNPHVIITTYFDDGSAVITANTSSASVFKSRPNFDGVSLADVADVAMLLDIHRFRVDTLAGGKRPLLPSVGRELEEMEQYERDTLDFQVKSGLAYFDTARQVYDRTWFGTFYMTWHLLWPLKQISLAKKQRKAAQTMAEYQQRRRGTQPVIR